MAARIIRHKRNTPSNRTSRQGSLKTPQTTTGARRKPSAKLEATTQRKVATTIIKKQPSPNTVSKPRRASTKTKTKTKTNTSVSKSSVSKASISKTKVASTKGKTKGKARTKPDTLKKKPGPLAMLSHQEFATIKTRSGLIELLKHKKQSNKEVQRVLRFVEYERELRLLQVEMVKLQQDVQKNGRRVAIVFEGRDAAGKGGCIRRFMEHLNPRAARVVALSKPSETERGQWYFQRYCSVLPNPGEICFFDRSWYNRAVVEPVMDFCKKKEYDQFMRQVPEFEHMLYEDGIEIVKFWFSISKREQKKRFDSRRENPLKQWKISPVDEQAQERWNSYTKYKEQMFSRTHTSFSPWIIVKANSKKRARLESIRYALSALRYEDKAKAEISISPDPSIVRRFHRSVAQID